MSVEAFLVRPLYPGYIAGGLVQGQSLAPVYQYSKLVAGGDFLEIVYDTPVTFGAGGNGGFTITPSGGAATLTYSSGDGTRTLVYSISRTIGPEETVTLDYVQPTDGVESVATGDDAVSLTAESVRQLGGGARYLYDFSLRF